MSLREWTVSWWSTKAVARKLQRIAHSFSMPAVACENGSWVVACSDRNTYRVILTIWANGTTMYLIAGSELVVDRDLLPRELAIVLLEENHGFAAGSFRLIPRGERRYVALGSIVDARTMPDSDVQAIGWALITKMQQTITKLYARELIIAGPHS